jgi:hypothetical protein
MISLRSSICSTARAAAFPLVFRNLRKRNCLPASCGALALMLGGASVGVQAQTGNFGTVNVGSTSPTPISVLLTFNTAETLGSTAVVTQVATGRDFADAGTGTCKAGTAYTAGESCTVEVNFSPKFPGTRYGVAELLDGSGNVLATGYFQGTGMGPQANFLPASQSIIADSANNGLTASTGVAVDASGNIYIADGRVLKETLSAGGYTQSIVANGLFFPEGVAVDGSGNVYIVDNGSRIVFKETLSAAGYTQSVVANAANNGLVSPYGVAVDGSGNVYITDVGNGQVLKETLSAEGYTQSVVANAVNNGLVSPYGVAVDGSGNVYIANDYFDAVLLVNNGQVWKETVSAGGYTQSIVANADGNPQQVPEAVAVDANGNVYIAEGYDDTNLRMNNSRVMKETLSAGGYIESTIADNIANHGLDSPSGVAVDSSGNVYIANYSSAQVLEENFTDRPSITMTAADNPKALTVENVGNAALTFRLPETGDNPSVPASFAWDPSSTCKQTTASSSAAFELATGASCTMAFDFKPTATGTIRGLAELTDNNLNVTGAEQAIRLTGMQNSQTITFPSRGYSVYYGGAPITLSATGGASGNPVIFSIVSGPGSLSGPNNSILNFTGWGTIYVAANQAGNINYTAAPQVTQSFEVLFANPAALTSPAPGSVLTGSSATFTWSPGVGPTEYMLLLGSTGVRSSNLYNSGQTPYNSLNVTGLPINGETIYARLYSFIGGAWNTLDYSYTAASQATLTSPAPSSTLTGSNVTFTWSAGTGVAMYYLFLGSNGVGSNNLYSSGYTTHKSVNVTGLPVNRGTVYARLYSYLGGSWHYLDYTYTAE